MDTRSGNQSQNAKSAAEGFDAVYSALQHSPTWRRIGREAYGDDYPEEADPFSTVTLTDLRRIAHELRVGPGQTFADIACGHGGPGLWVTRETGARLVGIDISQVAIEQARRRAEAFGLAGRAAFIVGDAAATSFSSASLTSVMSVDAFWLFPDKPSAAAEIARILQPGGRLVFTTWDCTITPPGWQPQLADHHALLQQAGFVVETYEETPDWERRQRAFYDAFDAARTELVAEMGDLAHGLFSDPSYIIYRKRILVVARKNI